MDERTAYITLNAIPEIGPVRVRSRLDVFGSAAALLSATESELERVPGIGSTIARAITNWRQSSDPEAEAGMASRAGVDILTLADPDYPSLLKEIHDPPLCLYVRGNVESLQRPNSSIAIVGSRHTTRYGVKMAESLAASASLAGWTVISGLARGIDTIAHETVVKTKGKTIAVVGSGLGRIYPQENLDLARRIADSAAVISEFPMMFPPGKRTFPMRNRIISGLSLGTIVVQAGDRSGSLITAGQALDQNRAVFAVPGPVDSPQSRGCHGMIKRGEAKLVETFQDVLEDFEFLPAFRKPERVPEAASGGRQPGHDDLTLTDNEAKLLALIGSGEVSLDDLVAETGLPPADVLAAIFTLELKHKVRQLPGRRVTGAATP